MKSLHRAENTAWSGGYLILSVKHKSTHESARSGLLL
jgi:hypothetical protein